MDKCQTTDVRHEVVSVRAAARAIGKALGIEPVIEVVDGLRFA